jgi:hypothetical protein
MDDNTNFTAAVAALTFILLEFTLLSFLLGGLAR